MQPARNLLILFSFVSLSHFAFASTGKEGAKSEPMVQGSVADAITRKPVKGVTIFIKTATNRHAVKTDESGNFKLPKIGGGKVTLVLEKKGYKTYRREGVELKEGMIINLNLDDAREEYEEEVFHPLQRMMDGF